MQLFLPPELFKQLMISNIFQPWPWYVVGPLIGLIVPLLLLIGNKTFGISSSLRHICAACIPGNIKFFKYDWKKESWNLFFVAGILLGGFLTVMFLSNKEPVVIAPELREELATYGINTYTGLVPAQLFNWKTLLTLKGATLMIFGGFLVGFGTRYAGGCTSGHAISGISNLQWPSVVATASFMSGGLIMANVILPFILKL